jgi:hypothetical protein
MQEKYEEIDSIAKGAISMAKDLTVMKIMGDVPDKLTGRPYSHYDPFKQFGDFSRRELEAIINVCLDRISEVEDEVRDITISGLGKPTCELKNTQLARLVKELRTRMSV